MALQASGVHAAFLKNVKVAALAELGLPSVISPGNLVAVGRVFPEGLAHPVCFISSL